jgi:predicted alpha/beta hydrolase
MEGKMRTITQTIIDGKEQLMPEDVVLLNKSDLESHRYELWAKHCRKKRMDFSKDESHTGVIFEYRESNP